MKAKLYAVYVFTKINTKRFFRNRVAIFFGILFPLIFLFVFGGIFGGSGNVSFNVALINESTSTEAQSVVAMASSSPILKVAAGATTLPEAEAQMQKGQLDAAIVLPQSFGETRPGSTTPSGQAVIYYTHNSEQASQALASVLEAQFKAINARYVPVTMPFTVATQESNAHALTSFDYTFAGLLGFAILGSGIFGPVNVFPELKKQGILRRFHTTPLRVWQYFVSTALSQAIVGLLTMAIMFIAAVFVFHLDMVGNYAELAVFLILSILMITGIGLAIGGWAKDQNQAAPLSNIIVFPMLFLSGTFFPRFLMPQWVQDISAYFPLTPVIDGVRMIATQGESLIAIWPQLGLVMVWMAVIYLVAFRAFRWD